jgi:hypothetical protein
MIKGPGELGECVGADAGLLTEDGSGGSGRGEADDLAAIVGPGLGEGAHSVVFPAPAGAIASWRRAPEVRTGYSQARR